jgi:SAM-dependent methyltransferase
MNHAFTVDATNRRTYGAAQVVDVYGRAAGHTDVGERAALALVEREVRGKPILDLGVGGGRTVPMLRRISDDYIGIDYTPALVRAAQARFPDADLRLGDARRLEGFEDDRFALVVFSFNGIDSVDHEERAPILREAHRVLRPGGVFWFSTHNYDGPMPRRRGFVPPTIRPTLNPLRLGLRIAQFYRYSALGFWNWQRNHALDRDDVDYCVTNCGAHDYGLMIHHIRLDAQKRELRAAGFGGEIEVLDSLRGKPVDDGDDVSAIPWFHVLARKRR